MIKNFLTSFTIGLSAVLLSLAGMCGSVRAAEITAPGCLDLFAKFDRNGSFSLPLLGYNQMLREEVDLASAEAHIGALLVKYERLNPSFPKKQFLLWLKKDRPIERIFATADLNAGKIKLGTLGEQLYREYFPFLKAVEKIPLKERIAGFSRALNEPFQNLLGRTQKNGKISAPEVESFVARAAKGFQQATLGGCLSRSDALFKNMLSNAVTGILMFSLHGAQNTPKRLVDFPWEFFVNGLIWSVIFDRVTCPKLIAREHQFGSEFVNTVEKQPFIATIKTRLAQGVVPFLPYYVAGDASAAVGSWAMDRGLRGVTSEQKPTEDYVFDWAFFNVWDMSYTIPKRILLLDSEIFTKGFPALQKAAEHLLQSGMAAKVVRYGSEYATKVAQAEYLHFEVFLQAKSIYDQVLPRIKEPIHAIILLPKKTFSTDSLVDDPPR